MPSAAPTVNTRKLSKRRPRRPAATRESLPTGDAPKPVALPHFPDRLHAFVWRNWPLVPAARMAAVAGASPADIRRLGRSLGLAPQPRLTADQQRRSRLSVIRRNWHLLPYDQLLALLDWTPAQLAFTLREDDFLYVKLGCHKPACEPLRFAPPLAAAADRARDIARVVRAEFPRGLGAAGEPLFHFVRELSRRTAPARVAPAAQGSAFSPRFCYSYFALYGDPLLEPAADPYPDGYLSRLAASGVDGVWLQAVLHKLARFPWQPSLSADREQRLANLCALVARARRHGIGVWLYLNEPRAMPLPFFDAHPGLQGVVEGDYAALCTSHPDVQQYLTEAVAAICRAVPDLAGFFTITASENLTNCWSHHQGAACPRCGRRPPGTVIAELNRLFHAGIEAAGQRHAPHPKLIVWDWGWKDEWAADVIGGLPRDAAFMSVSEWSLPIARGGIKSAVGEYSISSVGPGPRAMRHWALARRRGLQTIAKIQAGNTWELSAVPYIPAVANVARHAANLRRAGVDGLMLGWTLGGCPSPNLEVVAELGACPTRTAGEAMRRVAARRFGAACAPHVVHAWREFSAAFRQFPFAIGLVYSAPLQVGPANPLWAEPTGYRASMVGLPYDDLTSWRSIYPPDVFIRQLDKVAAGFDAGLRKLCRAIRGLRLRAPERRNVRRELGVAEAAAMHFRSVANQARFVIARDALASAGDPGAARRHTDALRRTLRAELSLAKRLWALQQADSRLGFEATNQYGYVPLDLAEKVLNCRDLLDRWLPAARRGARP